MRRRVAPAHGLPHAPAQRDAAAAAASASASGWRHARARRAAAVFVAAAAAAAPGGARRRRRAAAAGAPTPPQPTERRAARRLAPPSGRRRPPPRALAAPRAVRRGSARGRLRRARWPRLSEPTKPPRAAGGDGRGDQLAEVQHVDRRRAQSARAASSSAGAPVRLPCASVVAPTAAAVRRKCDRRGGVRRHVVDGRPALTERSAGRHRPSVCRGGRRRHDGRAVGGHKGPATRSELFFSHLGDGSPGDHPVRRKKKA